jgi:hypothetical protein
VWYDLWQYCLQFKLYTWLDALSFVNSSHFMKLYYFMKSNIFVIIVKDVSFTLVTKHSPDFRTVHLAVCPSSTHGGWIQNGSICCKRYHGWERVKWARVIFVVWQISLSYCQKFITFWPCQFPARSHIALSNVSFLLGAIVHCATILYSSDMWILMFVVHSLTSEMHFLISYFYVTGEVTNACHVFGTSF